jgi:hypothetical protein
MVLRLKLVKDRPPTLDIDQSFYSSLPLFNYNFVNIPGYYIFTLAS